MERGWSKYSSILPLTFGNPSALHNIRRETLVVALRTGASICSTGNALANADAELYGFSVNMKELMRAPNKLEIARAPHMNTERTTPFTASPPQDGSCKLKCVEYNQGPRTAP